MEPGKCELRGAGFPSVSCYNRLNEINPLQCRPNAWTPILWFSCWDWWTAEWRSGRNVKGFAWACAVVRSSCSGLYWTLCSCRCKSLCRWWLQSPAIALIPPTRHNPPPQHERISKVESHTNTASALWLWNFGPECCVIRTHNIWLCSLHTGWQWAGGLHFPSYELQHTCRWLGEKPAPDAHLAASLHHTSWSVM